MDNEAMKQEDTKPKSSRLAHYLGLVGAIAVAGYIGHHGYEWGMTFWQTKMWQAIAGGIVGGGVAWIGAMIQRSK